MSTQRSIGTKLVAALRRNQIVRFERQFDSSSTVGYVMDVGSQWFILALIDGRIRFDGFQCFRLSDVTKFEISSRMNFYEYVLKRRNEQRPEKLAVKAKSLEELLTTANKAFPLITIHREKVDPGYCYIGRLMSIKKEVVTLLEVGIDGYWHKCTVGDYALRDITKVSFGGDYEQALFMCGGYPPERHFLKLGRNS